MFGRGDGPCLDSDLSSSEESPAAQSEREECPEPSADTGLSVNPKLPHVHGFVRFFRFFRNDLEPSFSGRGELAWRLLVRNGGP